jgi:hypothetical protein
MNNNEIQNEKTNLDRITEMVMSAPTKMDAIYMLNTWRLYSNISEEEYNAGRLLINDEFNNNN